MFNYPLKKQVLYRMESLY